MTIPDDELLHIPEFLRRPDNFTLKRIFDKGIGLAPSFGEPMTLELPPTKTFDMYLPEGVMIHQEASDIGEFHRPPFIRGSIIYPSWNLLTAPLDQVMAHYPK